MVGWRSLLRPTALAVIVLLNACDPASVVDAPAYKLGGTLRIALLSGLGQPPDFDWFWEAQRCCLARSLYSYVGAPTDQGGALLRSDIAAGPPDVSLDGLTWTIHLKRGIIYAPPFQRTQVTSADFVRMLKEKALTGNALWSVISGFQDYAEGRTSSIRGLETPDAWTLRIHLNQVAGDLGYRLSFLAGPVPPNPRDPSDPWGADGNRSGYDQFILYRVSTGPYMVEGAGGVDYHLPQDQQQPPRGYEPGRQVTLVRNPSWNRSTDPLRPAYADRIIFYLAASAASAFADLDAGRADLVWGFDSTDNFVRAEIQRNPAVPEELDRYQHDSNLGSLDRQPADSVRYISINEALPPLDDIHVRKAINLVIDKASVAALAGGPLFATPFGHLVPDSLEEGVLVPFDPYRTPGSQGDLEAAKAEMRLSRYDPDRDGICDGAVCRGILAFARSPEENPALAAIATAVAADLAKIGLGLDVRQMPHDAFFGTTPQQHVGLKIGIGFQKDYPNASEFFISLFAAASIGSPANQLLGATPEQLRSWGYPVSRVPDVDPRIQYCISLIGPAQPACWATLDTYLMDEVVPMVPLFQSVNPDPIPSRLVHYSYDQAADAPAIDQIALVT
jgi:peptide/nickel transport system substrate-binding protein